MKPSKENYFIELQKVGHWVFKSWNKINSKQRFIEVSYFGSYLIVHNVFKSQNKQNKVSHTNSLILLFTDISGSYFAIYFNFANQTK